MARARDGNLLPYVMALSALVLVAGVWLSASVYRESRALNSETIELVDRGIPTLNQLSALRAYFAIQEAILYEYYASTDTRVFDVRWAGSREAITTRWATIKETWPLHPRIDTIETHDRALVELAGDLDSTLRHPPVDWDESRRLLERITRHALVINASLADLANDFHQNMHAQGKAAHEKVIILNRAIIGYGIAVVMVAILAGYFLHAHLLGVRERKRLAMFVERNPSPVLRLTHDGEVEYANPGAWSTLTALGVQQGSASVLLPGDTKSRTRDLVAQGRDWTRWEYTALGCDFEAVVHYLRDFGVFHAYLLDVTERKAARQQLEFLAYHDPLTELPNRRGFVHDIEAAIAEGRDFSVLLIRMDRLRRVVDGIGHGVMDQMTQALAKRLQQALADCNPASPDARLYRYEANIYGVLLPRVTAAQAITDLALALILRLEDAIRVENHEIFPGASVGASRHPADGQDAISLISHADQAMQQIRKGGLSFRLYEAGFSAAARERMALERDLRHALERQELFLLYQPQIEISNGRIIGAEALLRWQHPTRGLISPAQLIPIAEETGIIQEIGKWILHTACVQAQAWRASGLPLQRIAVNLSARQFISRDLIPLVSRTLAGSGLPASALELEITESLAMDDVPYSIDMLHALKELGVDIALDDFGTGYSSLAYLRQLPLDKLKIDKSFVCTLERDPADAILVKTICDLGHTLKLRTIAEGIETVGQLEYLRTIGCEEAQGYHFSPPVTPDEFEHMLGNQKGASALRILSST